MLGAPEEAFPEARCQRCAAHFYRNVLGRVPITRRKPVARAQGNPRPRVAGGSAPARRRRAAAELGGMRLGTAAKKVRDGIEETLTRTDLPP